MGPFRYNFQSSGDGVQLVLQGAITESAKFPASGELNSDLIIVNFTGVEYINSRGIAIWIRWVESARKSNSEIKFIMRGCRRNILDQINAIQGFAPEGTVVESIFAPYFCDSCDKLVDVALHLGTNYEYPTNKGKTPMIQPPFVKCPSCNKAMHMDVLMENFFYFLNLKSF